MENTLLGSIDFGSNLAFGPQESGIVETKYNPNINTQSRADVQAEPFSSGPQVAETKYTTNVEPEATAVANKTKTDTDTDTDSNTDTESNTGTGSNTMLLLGAAALLFFLFRRK